MHRYAVQDFLFQLYLLLIDIPVFYKNDTSLQVAIGTDDVYKSAAAVKLVTKELGGQIILPPVLIPEINTKITSFVDPDGWKTVSTELQYNFFFLEHVE